MHYREMNDDNDAIDEELIPHLIMLSIGNIIEMSVKCPDNPIFFLKNCDETRSFFLR